MKHQFFYFVTALLMLIPFLAAPADAVDLSYAAAEYTYVTELTAPKKVEAELLTDGMEATASEFSAGDTLKLKCESPIGGIYLKFDMKQTRWVASAGEAAIQFGTNGFLHEYADVSPLDSGEITLTFQEDTQICELRIFSAGKPPENVQLWQPPYDKADIALFTSHSDDETLFLLGLIPTAAAQGRRLQVIYFCQHNDQPLRRHEQLNGLWTSGCTHYPVIGRFPDLYSESIDEARNKYAANGIDEDQIIACQVEMLRRFKPNVICGHDINGEYGHGTHCLNAETLMKAVEIASHPEMYEDTAQKYGVWDVPKTYIHLLEDNPITLDFDTPLDYFGGRTAYQVSVEGYGCHYTQHWTWFTNWLKGTDEEPITAASEIEEYSPCSYGLWRSTVGEDTGIGDLFENIAPEEYPVETQPPAPETMTWTTTTTTTTSTTTTTTSTTTTTTVTTTVTTTQTTAAQTTAVTEPKAGEYDADMPSNDLPWMLGGGAVCIGALLLVRHLHRKKKQKKHFQH